jgi:hypothetical protein
MDCHPFSRALAGKDLDDQESVCLGFVVNWEYIPWPWVSSQSGGMLSPSWKRVT